MGMNGIGRTMALATLAGAAMSAGAQELDANLVIDGSFENVDPAVVGGFGSLQLVDWQDFSSAFGDPEDDDNFAYSYFDQGYAYVDLLTEPGAGDRFYTGGFGTGGPTDLDEDGVIEIDNNGDEPGGENELDFQIFQTVAIEPGSAVAKLIGGGTAQFELSAFFSSFFGQTENSIVIASFLDDGGQLLGTSRFIGGGQFVSSLGFNEEEEGVEDPFDGTRVWGQDRTVGEVPASTSSISIGIAAGGSATNYDGYVDLVDFRVGVEFPPVTPGPFAITAPLAGTFNTNGGPEIAWEASQNAIEYSVTIARASEPMVALVETITEETTLELEESTLPTGVYLVEIEAINADGETAASNGPVEFGVIAGDGGVAPGCNGADIVAPFGVLNSGDVTAFVNEFLGGCP